MDFEKELSKYSKEAIIKAIKFRPWFSSKHFIDRVIEFEIEILRGKEDLIQDEIKEILKEMNNHTGKRWLRLSIKYRELFKKGERIRVKIDKLWSKLLRGESRIDFESY